MLLLVGSISKLTVDLVVTSVPIPLVVKMQMARSRRYSVLAIFGLGYIVAASCAFRLYLVWKTFYANPLDDQSWFLYPCAVASSVENHLSLVSFVSMDSPELTVARYAPAPPTCARFLEVPARLLGRSSAPRTTFGP